MAHYRRDDCGPSFVILAVRPLLTQDHWMGDEYCERAMLTADPVCEYSCSLLHTPFSLLWICGITCCTPVEVLEFGHDSCVGFS